MSQAEVLTNLQYDLLEKNILDLAGPIDGPMASYVRYAINILKIRDCPPIEVWISSTGGEVSLSLDIYDMLITYPGKVTGKVIAFSQSMATIILQACDIRLATEHAKIMVHNPWYAKVSFDDLESPRRMKKIRDYNRQDREMMLEILQRHSGLSRKRLENMMKKGAIMFAAEALANKLIDGIIEKDSL